MGADAEARARQERTLVRRSLTRAAANDRLVQDRGRVNLCTCLCLPSMITKQCLPIVICCMAWWRSGQRPGRRLLRFSARRAIAPSPGAISTASPRRWRGNCCAWASPRAISWSPCCRSPWITYCWNTVVSKSESIVAPLDLRLSSAEVIRSLQILRPLGFAGLGVKAPFDFRELWRAVQAQCHWIRHSIVVDSEEEIPGTQSFASIAEPALRTVAELQALPHWTGSPPP